MSENEVGDLNLDQRIREQAYYSWEADGGPPGRDSHYWEQAQRSISAPDPFPGVDLQSINHAYEGGISAQPPVPANLLPPPKLTGAIT